MNMVQASRKLLLVTVAASVLSACGGADDVASPGEGTIIGSLLGVVLMALINNGLVLLNVSIYWQGIVSGIILIAAVTFDMVRRRSQG